MSFEIKKNNEEQKETTPINFDDFQNFDLENESKKSDSDLMQSQELENIKKEISDISKNKNNLFSQDDLLDGERMINMDMMKNASIKLQPKQDFIKKINNNEIIEKKEFYCFIHEEEAGLFYCQNCNSFNLCIQCLVKGLHNNHSVANIKQIFPILKEKYDKTYNIINEKSEKIKKQLFLIENQKKIIETNFLEIKKEKKEKFIEIRKIIDYLEYKLYEELEKEKNEILENIQKETEKIIKIEKNNEEKQKKLQNYSKNDICLLFGDGFFDEIEQNSRINLPNFHTKELKSEIIPFQLKQIFDKLQNYAQDFPKIKNFKESRENSIKKINESLTEKNIFENLNRNSEKNQNINRNSNIIKKDELILLNKIAFSPKKNENKQQHFYSKIFLNEKNRSNFKEKEYKFFSKNTFLSPNLQLSKKYEKNSFLGRTLGFQGFTEKGKLTNFNRNY